MIVPDANDADAATFEMVRAAKWIGIRVGLYPSLLAAVGGCAVLDELDGLRLLALPRFGLSRSSGIIKRTFDVVVATLALVATAPLIGVISIMIRLDTPGPVLFRQAGVGRNGRRFRMFKFRSMVDGADAMKGELVTLDEPVVGFLKIANDPSVTRVGSWLCRTRFDELPQPVERDPRRDEPGRTATADRGGGRADQRRGPLSAPVDARDHRTVADPRADEHATVRDGEARLLVHPNWSLWQDFDIPPKTALRVIDRDGH